LEHEFFKHGECDSSNEGQNVNSIGNKQKHGRMDDLLDKLSKKRFEHHQLTSISLLWKKAM